MPNDINARREEMRENFQILIRKKFKIVGINIHKIEKIKKYADQDITLENTLLIFTSVSILHPFSIEQH